MMICTIIVVVDNTVADNTMIFVVVVDNTVVADNTMILSLPGSDLENIPHVEKPRKREHSESDVKRPERQLEPRDSWWIKQSTFTHVRSRSLQ